MQPPSLGLRGAQHAGPERRLEGRVVADLDARDLRVFVGLLAGLAAAATVCVARGGGDGACGSSRTAGAALDAGRWRSCARGDREETKAERTATAKKKAPRGTPQAHGSSQILVRVPEVLGRARRARPPEDEGLEELPSGNGRDARDDVPLERALGRYLCGNQNFTARSCSMAW